MVYDIVWEVGVSLLMVDWVLNGCVDVWLKNVEWVKVVVIKFGYVCDINVVNLVKKCCYKFVFVLFEGLNYFVDMVFEVVYGVFDVQVIDWVDVEVVYVNVLDLYVIVKWLKLLDLGQFDGVVFMVFEMLQVCDVIVYIKSVGVYVVVLVFNLLNLKCDYFVGIDNFFVGQMVVVLIGKFLWWESGFVFVVINFMVV